MDRLSGETATQLKKIAEIFNCDLDNPEQLKELYVKLQGWAQAEKDGRLIVPPCKAGDTIYQLLGPKHAQGPGVKPRIVSCVEVRGQDYAVIHPGMTPCFKEDLGKTWFLTAEEAKAALKKGGDR